MVGMKRGSHAWNQRMLGAFVIGMRKYRSKLDEPDRDVDYKRFEQDMTKCMAFYLMGGNYDECVQLLRDRIHEEQ